MSTSLSTQPGTISSPWHLPAVLVTALLLVLSLVTAMGLWLVAERDTVEHNGRVSVNMGLLSSALQVAGARVVPELPAAASDLVDDSALSRVYRNCSTLRNAFRNPFLMRVTYPSLQSNMQRVTRVCSDIARLDAGAALKRSTLEKISTDFAVETTAATVAAVRHYREQAQIEARRRWAERLDLKELRDDLVDWR